MFDPPEMVKYAQVSDAEIANYLNFLAGSARALAVQAGLGRD
jgi:hypothetical protein